ncbi:MAG: cytochrome c oxidase subunit 3 family protein [Desulfotignum sp.]|jgi:cytochrome c oxidase subunit 3|nr:cytochrome c oxidase subunit 3 family protein [Desulfotignum sp.]
MAEKLDQTGKKLGMWLFLYTEIILFGGLFVLYAVYFSWYTPDFILGAEQLDLGFGVINTVILLVSSFLVAASITAVHKNQRNIALSALAGALICGAVFLVNKYFEWGHKIEIGIYPGSERLLDGPAPQNLFFGLYYVVTGLHGIHIVIGMVLLAVSFFLLFHRKITARNDAVLDNCGLYWHLVDLIWIFIFPLFYLVV